MMEELVPFGIIDTGTDHYEENPVVSTKGDSFLSVDHDGWKNVNF